LDIVAPNPMTGTDYVETAASAVRTGRALWVRRRSQRWSAQPAPG